MVKWRMFFCALILIQNTPIKIGFRNIYYSLTVDFPFQMFLVEQFLNSKTHTPILAKVFVVSGNLRNNFTFLCNLPTESTK